MEQVTDSWVPRPCCTQALFTASSSLPVVQEREVPEVTRTCGSQTLFWYQLAVWRLCHHSLESETRVLDQRNFYFKVCYAKEILVKVLSLRSQTILLPNCRRKLGLKYFSIHQINQCWPCLSLSDAFLLLLTLPSCSTSQQGLYVCSIHSEWFLEYKF